MGRDSEKVVLAPTKVIVSRNQNKVKSTSTKNALEVEEQLENLEAAIHVVRQQLECESELGVLQSLYSELEEMEKQRDSLYDELDKIS